MSECRYSIEQLSLMTGLTRRTIRYYIQEGLLEKPVGERRAAHYTNRHLEALLSIVRLTDEGLSLEAVRKHLAAKPEIVPAPKAPGTIRSCVHVSVAPGVELTIDAHEARLDTAQLRRLCTQIQALLDESEVASS